MYKVFESAMNMPFDLSAMVYKINLHNIMGNLTDAETATLINLARSKANPSGSLDVMAKLQDLENRVRALEDAKQDSTGDGEDMTEAVEEYTPGKWYHNGDQVMFNGKLYTCTAPAGGVCVWSPAEYPAYWEAADA